ncbi:unnamed protein product [Adineta steineri]|uniref:Acyltransferase n=1 Tax=Adineta steineri TaxID=433720 RepID=A0A813WQL4_9BILA|nr:unnamed protein product [Adineta steineri]
MTTQVKPSLVTDEVNESKGSSNPSTSASNDRIFAPLNIPWYRRCQTLTLVIWWLSPWYCLYLTFHLLFFDRWYSTICILLYMAWMYLFRTFPKTGGHRQQWLRKLIWWEWFSDYFPIHLHKTCDLPPDRPYIFGYHPHGIIALGAFGNFATEATGFEKLFPGINARFLVLNSNFQIPFYDLFLTMMGLCDASKESCNYILKQGKGNSIVLVLGGSKEALDAHPSSKYLGFEKLFPGINARFLVLNSNFQIPFYDLFLTMMGLCDASKESCNYILKQGKGNSIVLVLGGSKEALDAHPSSKYLLTLKNRKGFVKVALTNGASLVPVFSFGENDLYDQVPNPRGSKLRSLQMSLQKMMGYSLPLFHGRGIFQYKIGLLPNRHPINTYVGEPIEVPKLAPELITSQLIDEYHTKYMDALTHLFDTHKAKHGDVNSSIVFVDDPSR